MTPTTPSPISDQAAGEPNWSHPKLQALISRNARLSLQLGIIETLIDDPEHEYDTDGDYASAVTDKVYAFVKASRSTAPTTGSAPALNRSAFSDIVNERIRQTEQWGGVAHDDKHGSRDWFRFIAQQQEKCREAITETLNQQDWGHITNAYGEELIREETRMRLVKIAALAIAGIESNDRAALLAASMGGEKA